MRKGQCVSVEAGTRAPATPEWKGAQCFPGSLQREEIHSSFLNTPEKAVIDEARVSSQKFKSSSSNTIADLFFEFWLLAASKETRSGTFCALLHPRVVWADSHGACSSSCVATTSNTFHAEHILHRTHSIENTFDRENIP